MLNYLLCLGIAHSMSSGWQAGLSSGARKNMLSRSFRLLAAYRSLWLWVWGLLFFAGKAHSYSQLPEVTGIPSDVALLSRRINRALKCTESYYCFRYLWLLRAFPLERKLSAFASSRDEIHPDSLGFIKATVPYCIMRSWQWHHVHRFCAFGGLKYLGAFL